MTTTLITGANKGLGKEAWTFSSRTPDSRRLASQAAAVVAEVDPGAEVITFGHVADGNVHVNIVPAAPADGRHENAVFSLVASLGGSISSTRGMQRGSRHRTGGGSPAPASAAAGAGGVDPGGAAAGTVALPRMAGATNFGALGRAVCCS